MKYSAVYHVFPATFHVISRKIDFLWNSVRRERQWLLFVPGEAMALSRKSFCICLISTACCLVRSLFLMATSFLHILHRNIQPYIRNIFYTSFLHMLHRNIQLHMRNMFYTSFLHILHRNIQLYMRNMFNTSFLHMLHRSIQLIKRNKPAPHSSTFYAEH